MFLATAHTDRARLMEDRGGDPLARSHSCHESVAFGCPNCTAKPRDGTGAPASVVVRVHRLDSWVGDAEDHERVRGGARWLVRSRSGVTIVSHGLRPADARWSPGPSVHRPSAWAG